MHVSWPFATGRITPRQSRHSSDVGGFQATCTLPGHDSCNKTLAISQVGGSKDVALRMRKYWIILGEQYEDKKGLKGTWTMVVQAAKDDKLPTDEFLDECVSVSLAIRARDSEAPDQSAAAPSTPPDVQAQLQALDRHREEDCFAD